MFKPLAFGLGSSAGLLAFGQLGGCRAHLGLFLCDQVFSFQQPLSLFLLAFGLRFERRGPHLDLASGRLQRPIAFGFALLGRACLPLGHLGVLDGVVGFALGPTGAFVRAGHSHLLPLNLGAGGVGRHLCMLGVAPGLLQL